MKRRNLKPTADERIGFLANELIKELKKSGRSIQLPTVSEGYGAFDIVVYDIGSENERISINSILNKWDIRVESTQGR